MACWNYGYVVVDYFSEQQKIVNNEAGQLGTDAVRDAVSRTDACCQCQLGPG